MQPFAPHIAEELWEQLGGERLWEEPWPVADEAMLVADQLDDAVQVNGKVRGRVQLARGLDRDGMLAAARELPNVRAHLDGKAVVKEIVVPGKLVNLVTG